MFSVLGGVSLQGVGQVGDREEEKVIYISVGGRGGGGATGVVKKES